MFHGKGEYQWSDGSVYKGDFQENKMHGHGIFKWPNG